MCKYSKIQESEIQVSSGPKYFKTHGKQKFRTLVVLSISEKAPCTCYAVCAPLESLQGWFQRSVPPVTLPPLWSWGFLRQLRPEPVFLCWPGSAHTRAGSQDPSPFTPVLRGPFPPPRFEVGPSPWASCSRPGFFSPVTCCHPPVSLGRLVSLESPDVLVSLCGGELWTAPLWLGTQGTFPRPHLGSGHVLPVAVCPDSEHFHVLQA